MVNKKMHLVEKIRCIFYLKFFLRAITECLVQSGILAKISPRGKARMIRLQLQNQDAEVCRDITPRL